MMGDYMNMSSYGFMVNMSWLMMELCHPYTKNKDKYAKTFENIDTSYFETVLQLKDVELLGHLEESKDEVDPDDGYNFVTESFCLCHAYFHLAHTESNSQIKNAKRDYEAILKLLNKAYMAKDMQTMNTLLAVKHSYDAYYFSPKIQS